MKGDAEGKQNTKKSIMPTLFIVLGAVFVALILISQGLKNKNFDDLYSKFNAPTKQAAVDTAGNITVSDPSAETSGESASVEQQHTSLDVVKSPKGFLNDPMFTDAITIGLGIFALLKWIEFIGIMGTKPERMISGLILPIMSTFMAFKWTMILGWAGLLS